MIDYSYQIKAAQEVLKNALNNKYIASVLAACPSSGKTTISHICINNYLELFPNTNIVILTEGQKILQDQYISELDNANVEINFTYGAFGSNAQVQVGIPQNINKLNLNKIDLLIVDECHNYYLENMDQKIIKRFSPTHQIIMTGSPTKFNLHNKVYSTQYGVYYISAEELQKQGIFSGVDIDLVETKDRKNAHQVIKDALDKAKKDNANLDKIMIACPTINFAKKVKDYLNYHYGDKVSLSTSKDDSNNTEIEKFKKGINKILIVVDKGILGFNDKNITTLFDFKSSYNLDSSYQLFARVLRIHPNNIRKSYYRIADNDYNKQYKHVIKMLALMKTNIFKKFTGNNIELERK
jgi:superfamily II DNA or RNA helicase